MTEIFNDLAISLAIFLYGEYFPHNILGGTACSNALVTLQILLNPNA
jgi:hypothetical protein